MLLGIDGIDSSFGLGAGYHGWSAQAGTVGMRLFDRADFW